MQPAMDKNLLHSAVSALRIVIAYFTKKFQENPPGTIFELQNALAFVRAGDVLVVTRRDFRVQ